MSHSSLLPRPGFLATLVGPEVLEFWGRQLNPAWSQTRTLARVVGRRVEARDTVTLRLKPNRHFKGFAPGQHVNVAAEVNGRRVTRSYSLSDIPRADRSLAITVKRIPGGVLSTHLVRDLEVGDVLELSAPFGDLLLNPAAPAWLLLAAGSGITPLMSLLRALDAQGMPVPVTLVYWARQRDELCYADELRALALRHPQFRLHLALTREPTRLPDELGERLQASTLQQLVPDLAGRQVYACGPAGFVQSARELCEGRAAGFKAEAFTPPPMPADVADSSVRVSLARSGGTLEIRTGQSLLSALEGQGLRPAYGCRIGICNTCACTRASGATQDLNTGAFSQEPNQTLRLCISRAVTDLTLDL